MAELWEERFMLHARLSAAKFPIPDDSAICKTGFVGVGWAVVPLDAAAFPAILPIAALVLHYNVMWRIGGFSPAEQGGPPGRIESWRP